MLPIQRACTRTSKTKECKKERNAN